MAAGFELIGVGSPMVDSVVNVDDAFLSTVGRAKGGMELINSARMAELLAALAAAGFAQPVQATGGSAANTTYSFTRLGGRGTFLGKLGDDRAGDFYRRRLAACGVDGSRFKTAPGMPTGSCLSLVTPDSERTMCTDLGAAAALQASDLLAADFADCAIAHLEGYLVFNHDLIRAVIAAAKTAGCRVSLDLAAFDVVAANHAVLTELLADIDIVLANEDEARAFTGSADPEVSLRQLGEHCRTVAVKLGAAGAWIKSADEVVRVPARPAVAVDTTGAGDAWAAGLFYGLARGASLRAAGEMGAVLGAEAVQVYGAAIPDHRWPYIEQQIGEIR